MLVSVKEYRETTLPDYGKIIKRRCICPKCGSTEYSIMHSDISECKLDGTPKLIHADVRCMDNSCEYMYSIFVKTNNYIGYRIMSYIMRCCVTLLLMIAELLAILNF